MSNPRKSYTFKEGLTMMAAKAVGIDPYIAAEAGESARAALNAIRNARNARNVKDRAAYAREAQAELSRISSVTHSRLVNALNAKLLSLLGRGRDTEVAHVAPGEVVVPRDILSPELAAVIAREALKHGIHPARLIVGERASVNPSTGAEEFGIFDKISGLFGGKDSELHNRIRQGMPPISTPEQVEIRYAPEVMQPELNWKSRWGYTAPEVVAQRAFNDYFAPETGPQERSAINQALRQRFLTDPHAAVNS